MLLVGCSKGNTQEPSKDQFGDPRQGVQTTPILARTLPAKKFMAWEDRENRVSRRMNRRIYITGIFFHKTAPSSAQDMHLCQSTWDLFCSSTRFLDDGAQVSWTEFLSTSQFDKTSKLKSLKSMSIRLSTVKHHRFLEQTYRIFRLNFKPPVNTLNFSHILCWPSMCQQISKQCFKTSLDIKKTTAFLIIY